MTRDTVRKIISTTIGCTTSHVVNGPWAVRTAAAFALDCVDDRRRIKTGRGD